MLNGHSADVEKIIAEVYEGKFKDRETLHNMIHENEAQINLLIREGVTSLGPYLGEYNLGDREIFPVLMGEVIAHIPQDKVSSLEDKFMRVLRYDYSARFNVDPEATLAYIRGKVEVSEGNRKVLYEKLQKHYDDVLKLGGELN